MVRYLLPLTLGVGAALGSDLLKSLPPEEEPGQKKSPRMAVVLSLICPGLGHLYCGQYLKGIGLIVLTLICAVLSLAVVGLILLSALSAWAIYDAYQAAVRINREAAVVTSRAAPRADGH